MSRIAFNAHPRSGPRGRLRIALASLLGILVGALFCPRVSASDPWDPEGPYAEAFLAGRYAEAIDQIGKALEETLGVASPLWYADRAELYFLTGRYEEAISEMGDAVRRIYEPAFTARLAFFYEQVGKLEDARYARELARMQTQSRYRQDFPNENLIAVARLARAEGENPRRVLQILQERLLGRYPDFARGFEAAGEVALEGYGYELAEKYFLAALEIDGERQPALAGLAATYYLAGDPRFAEIRARLEALNPNHPRLQCLVIDQALAGGDLATASTEIERLLKVNPLHFDGLAYLAASAFLDGDDAQRDATLARLVELRPGSADGHRIVAEVAARRYRFEEAVALLRAGLALEPENNRAKAALGLNLLRLGEDNTGRVLLEEVFAVDAFNVQVYNMLEVMDTLDDFATLASPEFEVRLPGAEAVVMGPAVEALLLEALARYEGEYGLAVKRPVAVQMFDDHDEFMVRSVGLPGNPGHLGICFGNLVTLDSPRARPPATMNWRSVLWHEFVHVITLQKTGNRIPRWLSEGISVYEETQRDPAWGQALDPAFKPLFETGAWPGVSALEAYFVRPETPLHLMAGYFLSGEFVAAYVNAHGKPALVSALESIGAGTDTIDALRVAAGIDAAGLDRLFADHLTVRCAPLAALPAVAEDGAVTPGTFDLALDAGIAARMSGDLEAALAHLETAASLYPDYPGERNPLRQIAAIQAERGVPEPWRDAVMRLRRHDPLAWGESRALLDACIVRGDWTGAMEQVEWCVGINPFDITLQEARRDALRGLGRSEEALAALDALEVLDGERATALRLEKAAMLTALARKDEARRLLLEILEAYPEFGEAQAQLLALHETEGSVNDETP